MMTSIQQFCLTYPIWAGIILGVIATTIAAMTIFTKERTYYSYRRGYGDGYIACQADMVKRSYTLDNQAKLSYEETKRMASMTRGGK